MAKILTEKEIKTLISDGKHINNASIECVEGIKYDFRVGEKILKAQFGQPRNITEISGDEAKHLFIKPGEVVFVMTEEELDLPNNIFIQLSEKRKMSHAGVVTLGGFTVDPQYKGRLLFGLYNISSKDFPIRKGKKVAGAVFHRLDENEICESNTAPEPMFDFPDDLVRLIEDYVPITSQHLEKNIEKMQMQIKALQDKIENNEKWVSDFKSLLEGQNSQIKENNSQINRISQNLDKEIQQREHGQEKQGTVLSDIEKNLSKFNGKMSIMQWVGGGLLATALVFLAVFLTKVV